MHAYDLVMLAVLIGATWFGARKGLAWQIASIASLVFSYLAALRFSDQIAPYINAQPPWNRFGAMLVIYLAVSLGVWLVFRMISNLIEQVKLRDFDRHVGAVVGLAKGVLLCLVITFFAVTLSAAARDAVLKSKSGHYIAKLLDKADAVMPPELDQVLRPYLEKLENGLDPNQAPPSPDGSRPGDPPRGVDISNPRTANADPWPPRYDGTPAATDSRGFADRGNEASSGFVPPPFRPSTQPSSRPSQPDRADDLIPLRPLRDAVEQGVRKGLEELVPLRPHDDRDRNSPPYRDPY